MRTNWPPYPIGSRPEKTIHESETNLAPCPNEKPRQQHGRSQSQNRRVRAHFPGVLGATMPFKQKQGSDGPKHTQENSKRQHDANHWNHMKCSLVMLCHQELIDHRVSPGGTHHRGVRHQEEWLSCEQPGQPMIDQHVLMVSELEIFVVW